VGGGILDPHTSPGKAGLGGVNSTFLKVIVVEAGQEANNACGDVRLCANLKEQSMQLASGGRRSSRKKTMDYLKALSMVRTVVLLASTK
jgi:hypothetical protein